MQPKLTGNGHLDDIPPVAGQKQDKHASHKLHLTAPNMSKPYSDVPAKTDSGILDKIADALNTAKDIAFVLWTVGW